MRAVSREHCHGYLAVLLTCNRKMAWNDRTVETLRKFRIPSRSQSIRGGLWVRLEDGSYYLEFGEKKRKGD